MKHKQFYDHLVEITEITIELGEMDLTKDERIHLISIVRANIHSKVIDLILVELSIDDKKTFLKNITAADHIDTWNHLDEKIEKAEDKIKEAIVELKKEFLKDIKKAKKLHNKK